MATDPRGAWLATGSTTPSPDVDDDFYEKGGALVLYDIGTGAPAASASMAPGGVGGFGSSECLVFSPSGARLLVAHDTNCVTVFGVQSSRLEVLAEVGIAVGFDAPPAVAWHGDDALIVGAGDHFATPADVSVSGDKHPAVRRLRAVPEEAYLASTRLHRSIAISRVMGRGAGPDAVLGIDVVEDALAFRIDLPRHPIGSDTGLWVSPNGQRAVYAQPGAMQLLDGASGERLLESPLTGGRPDIAVWSPRADRLAIITESTVVLFAHDRPSTVISRPLRELLRQDLPDGVPFAFSPDDDGAVCLTASGQLERLAGPSLEQVVWRQRETNAHHAVLWPRPDTIITLGLRAITFRNADDGALRSAHAW